MLVVTAWVFGLTEARCLVKGQFLHKPCNKLQVLCGRMRRAAADQVKLKPPFARGLGFAGTLIA
jgi:hypothetical protein